MWGKKFESLKVNQKGFFEVFCSQNSQLSGKNELSKSCKIGKFSYKSYKKL